MYRKQIMFDIDIKVTKEILGDEYRKIYDDIRNHLEENGFDFCQGSICMYLSKNPMTDIELTNIINDLLNKNGYISKCVRNARQFDVSNVESLKAVMI